MTKASGIDIDFVYVSAAKNNSLYTSMSGSPNHSGNRAKRYIYPVNARDRKYDARLN